MRLVFRSVDVIWRLVGCKSRAQEEAVQLLLLFDIESIIVIVISLALANKSA